MRLSSRVRVLVIALGLCGCSFVSVKSVAAHGPAGCTSRGPEPTIDLIVAAVAGTVAIVSAVTVDAVADAQVAGIVIGTPVAITYSISGLLGRRWVHQCRAAQASGG